MEEGIYEELVTESLDQALGAGPLRSDQRSVDKVDQPHVFARHIASIVERQLRGVSDQAERIAVANDVLRAVNAQHDLVADPAKQLLRVYRDAAPGVRDRTKIRPSTPLSEVALLTNSGNGEPSIGHELPAEMASADSVDLVCAFIRWSGVRLLEPQLRDLAAAGKRLRVITTTYLGSTERKTLDRLVNDYNAEVMVQYDALRTRLHAKAWLFRRNSGFDTAYIGSSNLSNAALIDGVEWNVRLSRTATPSLLDRFEATFETYWSEDPSFERYDPSKDGDRLDDALAEASGRSARPTETLQLAGLEVRPYPYQEGMLEELWAERTMHDRHWNLVVAATGTGKTVLAALDYRHLYRESGGRRRPRLLFVAHRHEILEQARRTFREVLTDPDFGELYVSGQRPDRWEHVFASVQSLHSYDVQKIPGDHFEVVIIDEFHHAAASTYRRLLDHLRPKELLGLTATPERADGVNVAQFFGNRIATELRLWDALSAELLCPFHYFGISDGIDLTRVTWDRGRYDPGELERIYSGSDARVRLILKSMADKLTEPREVRALGFCVSVKHAEFMALKFNEAGIPSAVVHGETPQSDRQRVRSDLQCRSVNVVFSVDVFNEGVDIPEVDTILMLRPTESATIFLQQLGRGLRRTEGKPVLTVLDFVGHQCEEFRWDLRLRAMTGRRRSELAKDVEKDFPFLPAGCRIVFDESSQESVLSNLKQQLSARWPDMVKELRGLSAASDDVSLGDFLKDTGLGLAEVLGDGRGKPRSWILLRRAAGLEDEPPSPFEGELAKRVRAFAHLDDPVRLNGFLSLLAPVGPSYESMSPAEQTLARMMFFNLWPAGGGHASYGEGLRALRSSEAITREIDSVIRIASDRSRQLTRPLGGTLAKVPLQIHARYNREEILAGLGHASLSALPAYFREGVKYFEELNVDAFFVTLEKSDSEFSPTTMYRDYPISRSLFHWESQSTTRLNSPTGQRYVNGTSTVLLFARTHKDGDFGVKPYLFLGPATIVDHQGERPIAITWKLEYEMPAEFFNEAKVAAG